MPLERFGLLTEIICKMLCSQFDVRVHKATYIDAHNSNVIFVVVSRAVCMSTAKTLTQFFDRMPINTHTLLFYTSLSIEANPTQTNNKVVAFFILAYLKKAVCHS